jgi:hypothetical protein
MARPQAAIYEIMGVQHHKSARANQPSRRGALQGPDIDKAHQHSRAAIFFLVGLFYKFSSVMRIRSGLEHDGELHAR